MQSLGHQAISLHDDGLKKFCNSSTVDAGILELLVHEDASDLPALFLVGARVLQGRHGFPRAGSSGQPSQHWPKEESGPILGLMISA